MKPIGAFLPQPAWPAQAPPPPTDAEIAAVNAKVAMLKAESLARNPPAKHAPIKPAYLTPEQLLAVLRPMAAAGNSAAATRVAGLEKFWPGLAVADDYPNLDLTPETAQ